MKLDRRDLFWVVLIAVSLIAGIAVSWERWGNPLVDCGREMNQPLRIIRGEALYSDIRHIYGPLSPYFNAALFKVFGASLGVLYASGIVTVIIVVVLVYWLSRRIMSPAAAGAATLSVMWLCALKQAGNYVLPYSFSASHGCLLGLIALATAIRFAASRSTRAGALWLTASGIAAGLAVLSKTEMGVAALVTGLAAVVLAPALTHLRRIILAALFIVPAFAIPVIAYWSIAATVGWHTLSHESYVLLTNLPAELVYFNKRMFGFDRPLDSAMQMLVAAVKLGLLALMIATASQILASRRASRPEPQMVTIDAGKTRVGLLWLVGLLAVVMFVLFSFATQVDKGPYMAMPLVLIALLTAALLKYRKHENVRSRKTLLLILIEIYALASLARVILRVRSGGAYSSYLLPASVIIFTYAGAYALPRILRERETGRMARRIFLAIILVWVLATATVFSVRYRRDNDYPISTDRGTIIAVPELGEAFVEAIDFIQHQTSPGEPIAVVPEGTSLNFLTDRPNPLREEIVTPGFLDQAGEERAIARLAQSNTRFVFIANRPTPEFGAAAFGRDYCRRLMSWLDENFEPCAVFGVKENPAMEIGNETFFIRALRRKQ